MEYHMKKYLSAALLSALFLTGCQVGNVTFNYVENPNSAPPEPVLTEESAQETTAETTAETTPEQTAEPDADESDPLYLDLYEHLRQGELSFTLNLPNDGHTYLQLTQRMQKEHPELFWLSYSAHITYYGDYAELTFQCYEDINPDEIPTMCKQFDQAAAEVLAQVPEHATDYEKILFIHDWIIDHTTYDSDGRDSGRGGIYSSAYGAIVNGKAVCSGYANAFQYFMNQFGIEGDTISGLANGESHGWNYVVLDGEYYWVDVTWDDSTIDDEFMQQLFHRYMLVPDEVLLRDHTPDASPESNLFIPTCSGTKYNYFRMNNCYFESYSLEALMDTLNAHTKEDAIEVMFRNQQDYEQACHDLFHENQLYHMGTEELQSFRMYFCDDATYTLKLNKTKD